MRDLEELLGRVRNPDSRTQLAEAVRAYNAGAYRASIISTWVSVALDLVAKLRELADHGDPAARKQIATLDQAIESPNKKRLQEFENDLLSCCLDPFQLIDHRDVDVLQRLRHDRNVCAHPAFVAPDDVFAPTAELARSHLAAAVDAVLQHPPTPGKSLIERFKAECSGTAWPSEEDLADYLRDRYFGRARESAKRQISRLIVKWCLNVPADDADPEQTLRRVSACAHVLSEINPALFLDALQVVVEKEEGSGLTDDEILCVVRTLGGLQAFWQVVPPTSVTRFANCVKGASDEDVAKTSVLSVDAKAGPVTEAIAHRVSELDNAGLAEAVVRQPAPSLVLTVLQRLASSRNFATSNLLLPLLVPLAPFLTVDDLTRLKRAVMTNPQVHQAFKADPSLTQLYETCNGRLGASLAWQEMAGLANEEGLFDGDGRPAFPSLRKAVDKVADTA